MSSEEVATKEKQSGSQAKESVAETSEASKAKEAQKGGEKAKNQEVFDLY